MSRTQEINTRHTELSYLVSRITHAESCAVVGLSNTGKSTLLRALASPTVQARYLGELAPRYAFVYVDFNLMLELSEQAFYEVVLRNVLDLLNHFTTASTLHGQIINHYQQVIEPSHPFRAPLAFNEAIMVLGERLGRRIVFLFDEFDEPFTALDSRVFLNLRALKDRYGPALCYVTATVRPLTELRQEPEANEFCELFAGRTYWLVGLSREDAQTFIRTFAQEEGTPLDEEETRFVWEQAGGHPGLIQAVTRTLIRLAAGAPAELRQRGLNLVREELERDPTVHSECTRLWEQLRRDEQEGLLTFVVEGPQGLSSQQRRNLQRKGILLADGENLHFFGRLFEGFVRRQRLLQEGARRGVFVDVDAGEVWVDGHRVPTLTDLEYRLLLFLYGRINRLCTKYQIVEAVWGSAYIAEVDDARIEKLISRLRAKLEPDPAAPRYLLTVRGRGYKLVSPGTWSPANENS